MTALDLGARLGVGLRNILAGDPLGLAQQWLKGIQALRESLTRGRMRGVYEVLSHHTTLDLQDIQGQVAMVERVETVRFLQDYVAAFTDYAWGDGDIFAEYRCEPGVPVDFYQDGSRRAVLISLREAKHKGDELTFRIHRKVLGGFKTPDECWETEVYHRMQDLAVRALFPRERRCRRATILQRSTSRTVVLGPECFQFLEDGRQQLTWSLPRPRLHERYALHWQW